MEALCQRTTFGLFKEVELAFLFFDLLLQFFIAVGLFVFGGVKICFGNDAHGGPVIREKW